MIIGTVSTAQQQAVANQVFRAETMFERMRGLLSHPPLSAEQGYWLEPCNSVHTFGMRYALDVIFLDAGGLIVKIVENLRPWRIAGAIGARVSLELQKGAVGRLGLTEGQKLNWQPAL